MVKVVLILAFSIASLRIYYNVQRKLFKRIYYSFYELVTGIPKDLSYTDLILLRFLPPMFISAIVYFIFKIPNIYFYSLIGAVGSLVNIIPATAFILKYKGDNEEIMIIREGWKKLLLIYMVYFISFTAFSYFGALFAMNFNPNYLKPDFNSIRDELYGALILVLISFMNKKIK